MKYFNFIAIVALLTISFDGLAQKSPSWSISALPSSVRLDPTNNTIIEDRFTGVDSFKPSDHNLLDKNWVYDGKKIDIYAARGEYVSFQMVLTNHTNETLKGIVVKMEPFKNESLQFNIEPELFLEWSVQVLEPSTGYEKATLGKGWYPDALIPFNAIQQDTANINRMWVYPLRLPDFNNRIPNQKSMMVWVDQYIPFEETKAKAGLYTSNISVQIYGETKSIPVNLHVWDFEIPNENQLKACVQQEGFTAKMDSDKALEIYQLFKRNRLVLLDPNYRPEIKETKDFEINWTPFDKELTKYFNGDAFTKEMGYDYGPGYGEPIELFALPFNVYGKHKKKGWPDLGTDEDEQESPKKDAFIHAVQYVRNHLDPMVDAKKTDFIAYLNGLDESYFPEAWDRMVYYGDLLKKYYPEAHFRIDGGYSEEAMAVVKNSINSWASHTINYDYKTMKKYQDMGIEDWIYGPTLYETKSNAWVGSNTFMDLSFINDRAISWATWKYHAYSWISWGAAWNWQYAWYDPETWKGAHKAGSEFYEINDYKKINGSSLLMYKPGIIPNVKEVCPSMRLKATRDGIQEYEYMRLLAQKDGNRKQVDKIVNKIIKKPFGKNAIGNLDVWSFESVQWDQARIELGKRIDQKK